MALNTYSPNTVIESAKHNADHQGLADGSNDVVSNSLSTFRDETFYDFIASGCLWTGDSIGVNRNASMSSGVVYIGGTRIPVSAVTARTFTASKDTYIDVDNTGALTYTEVANNAASPALAVNNLRLGIITTDGTKIAAAGNINQGQTVPSGPTVSNIVLSLVDTLGNLIYNRNPNPGIIGYKQISANQTGITTQTDINGLSCPVIVPANRKVRISFFAQVNNTTANSLDDMYIIDTTGPTQLQSGQVEIIHATTNTVLSGSIVIAPSSGLHTYKIQALATNSMSVLASSTAPAYILVELL